MCWLCKSLHEESFSGIDQGRFFLSLSLSLVSGCKIVPLYFLRHTCVRMDIDVSDLVDRQR